MLLALYVLCRVEIYVCVQIRDGRPKRPIAWCSGVGLCGEHAREEVRRAGRLWLGIDPISALKHCTLSQRVVSRHIVAPSARRLKSDVGS